MRSYLTLLLILGLAGCGGDGSTRFCFGSDAFCDRVFSRNLPPRADAGTAQQVTSGTQVRLDGSASRDPEGHIATYSWVQESGPTVVLEQATEPVASFQAPLVQATVTLTFRLVVTDDLGASDAARVTITIVPGSAGALARGLEQLNGPLRPDSPTVSGQCADCQAFLGLWLAARVEAVAAERDAELDRLLDELRVVALERHAAPGGAALGTHMPSEARRLLELGMRTVAAFTDERDPATSHLMRAGPDPERPVAPDEWAVAIAAALPGFAGAEATLDELAQASAHLLGGEIGDIAPEWIAAATLLLALTPADSPTLPNP
jgi:hypothetical protein